jgi:hypothetical protein
MHSATKGVHSHHETQVVGQGLGLMPGRDQLLFCSKKPHNKRRTPLQEMYGLNGDVGADGAPTAVEHGRLARVPVESGRADFQTSAVGEQLQVQARLHRQRCKGSAATTCHSGRDRRWPGPRSSSTGNTK